MARMKLGNAAPPPPPTNTSSSRTFAATEHIWEPCLNKASSALTRDGVHLAHTSPKYLHTNASSHKWVLGAIAEITDNAIDEAKKPEGASIVSISLDNDMLSVTDDGHGMTPETCHYAVSFGYSSKAGASASIGRYGNGLKSATMRIGRDALVLTVTLEKARVLCTAALLSMTYHVDNNLTELRVPLKTWERTGHDGEAGAYKRLFEPARHVELQAILKYSPYGREEDLLKEFERIAKKKKGVARKAGTGTKVVVHNLYQVESGDSTELLATEDDVIIAGEAKRHVQLQEWEQQLMSVSVQPSSATHKKAVSAGACPHLAALKSGKDKVDLLLERAQAHKYSLRAYLAILYRQLPTTFQMKVQDKVLSVVDVIEQFGKLPAQYDYRPRATTTAGGDGATSSQQLTLAFNAAMPFSNLHGICMYSRGRLIVPFCEVYHSNWSQGRGVIGVIDVENLVDPDHCKQGLQASEERTRLINTLQRRVLEFFKARGSHVGFKAQALVGKRRKRTEDEDDDDDDDENASKLQAKLAEPELCVVCSIDGNGETMYLCSGKGKTCENLVHRDCIDPKAISRIESGADWYCPGCKASVGPVASTSKALALAPDPPLATKPTPTEPPVEPPVPGEILVAQKNWKSRAVSAETDLKNTKDELETTKAQVVSKESKLIKLKAKLSAMETTISVLSGQLALANQTKVPAASPPQQLAIKGESAADTTMLDVVDLT